MLPDALRERGAEVDVVALYETVARGPPTPTALEAAAGGRLRHLHLLLDRPQPARRRRRPLPARRPGRLDRPGDQRDRPRGRARGRRRGRAPRPRRPRRGAARRRRAGISVSRWAGHRQGSPSRRSVVACALTPSASATPTAPVRDYAGGSHVLKHRDRIATASAKGRARQRVHRSSQGVRLRLRRRARRSGSLLGCSRPTTLNLESVDVSGHGEAPVAWSLPSTSVEACSRPAARTKSDGSSEMEFDLNLGRRGLAYF